MRSKLCTRELILPRKTPGMWNMVTKWDVREAYQAWLALPELRFRTRKFWRTCLQDGWAWGENAARMAVTGGQTSWFHSTSVLSQIHSDECLMRVSRAEGQGARVVQQEWNFIQNSNRNGKVQRWRLHNSVSTINCTLKMSRFSRRLWLMLVTPSAQAKGVNSRGITSKWGLMVHVCDPSAKEC